MKNISTFRLALWAGLFVEAIACSSIVFFLGYGSTVRSPSGFAAELYHFAFMFQLPGMWLASRCIPFAILFVPFMVLTATMLFAILFWMGISIWRRFHGRKTSA